MKLVILSTLLLALVAATLSDEHHGRNINRETKDDVAVTEDATYWKASAQKSLTAELNKLKINAKAKNVILFLGDGMSISTITASRIYKGQKAGKTGEESQLSFDKFPYTALSRTYCTDAQVADSACSATAYLRGVKTDTDTIGLDANVVYKDCSTQNKLSNRVTSVMDWAQEAGKGTGVVTTTRVTHATPAGAYAHAANRDWEDDTYVAADGQDKETCDDIAEQLVLGETGKNLKVILGGGRAYFLPNTTEDPETGTGRRQDGQDLIQKWKETHPNGSYVTDRTALNGLDLTKIDSLMGLFSPGHLDYFLDSTDKNDPTLEEMTFKAITMLQKETNGFVLLVEGGRIDQAHHDAHAKYALEETLQFDLAIQTALDMTSRLDTLIIVTADHSHTMTINGYSDRGSNILGLSGAVGNDSLPYTTLSYANGPGYINAFNDGERVNLTDVDTTDDAFLQPGLVPLNSETHGGDDVAIFATGPFAHLFQGVYEQNYIAHVMGYAACIGPGMKYCEDAVVESAGNNLQINHASITILFCFTVAAILNRFHV